MRFALLLLLLVAPLLAVAQFGGKRPPPPKAPVRKEDLKFIRCQTCELMARQSVRIYKSLHEEAGPKRVSEADVLEQLEKMCDPDTDPGDWITQIDIVEKGSQLELKDTGAIGKCNSECRTIAKACDVISEELDLTDLSAMVIKGRKRAELKQWMCYDNSEACLSKAPPVPAGRKAGEAHTPLGEDEIRTVKMMRKMKTQGMSGTLYDRETMLKEMEEMKETYGDDEDFANMFAETEANLKKGAEGGAEGGAASGASSSTAAQSVSETLKAAAGSFEQAAAAVREGVGKVADKVGSVASTLYNKVVGKKEGEL